MFRNGYKLAAPRSVPLGISEPCHQKKFPLPRSPARDSLQRSLSPSELRSGRVSDLFEDLAGPEPARAFLSATFAGSRLVRRRRAARRGRCVEISSADHRTLSAFRMRLIVSTDRAARSVPHAMQRHQRSRHIGSYARRHRQIQDSRWTVKASRPRRADERGAAEKKTNRKRAFSLL